MTCSHCPHCQANAAHASLRLPTTPPQNLGAAGIDTGFYVRFARAYDRARTLGAQPMRRLQDVNPWLTDSQCKSYLKRARTLGLVQTPARSAPAAEPTIPTTPDDGLSYTARLWRDGGDRVSVRMAKAAGRDSGPVSEDEARTLLAEWVDAGLATWDGPNAVQFPPPPGA